VTKRYELVKSALRSRIETGAYRRGERIPSGTELMREFGVSVITVRRALRDLEMEGLIIGHQGLGVFVSNQPRINRSLNPPYIRSLGDEMRRAGVEPGLRELSSALIVPENSVLAALLLPADTVVHKHERVVLADNRPVGLDITYMPRALGDKLRPDMGHDFLMPILDRHEISYAAVRYRLEACSLTEREASALESPVGSPLLSIRYSPVDAADRPLFLGHMMTRAEWFSWEFRVEHAGATPGGSPGVAAREEEHQPA
jgi:GntR family transcriptional regulator